MSRNHDSLHEAIPIRPQDSVTIEVRPGTANPVHVIRPVTDQADEAEAICACCGPSGCECCGPNDVNKTRSTAETTRQFQGRAIPIDPNANDKLDGITEGYMSINPIGDLNAGAAAEFGLVGQKTLNMTGMPEEFEPACLHYNTEGKLIPQPEGMVAMTAYGTVPVPDEVLKDIPTSFFTQPVVQERDVFVVIPEIHERVMEKNYTQFEHKFIEVEAHLNVDKIVPKKVTTRVQFPKYEYKPFIEEKIMEVPQGVKYVEVPVEVPMQRPPIIVPKEKLYVVERVVHVTRPIVQEKIIEKFQIIKRKVPLVVVKEIPYVIPRYVEHVLEVPYDPTAGRMAVETEGTVPSEYYSTEQAYEAPDLVEQVYEIPDWAVLPEPQEQSRVSEEVLDEEGSPVPVYQMVEDQSGRMVPMTNAFGKKIQLIDDHGNKVFERRTLVKVNAVQDRGYSVDADGLTLNASCGENPMPHTIFTTPGIKKLNIPYNADIDIEIIRGTPPSSAVRPDPRYSMYNGPMPCCHGDCCKVGQGCCNGSKCGAECCGAGSERRKSFAKKYNAYHSEPGPRFSTARSSSVTEIDPRDLGLEGQFDIASMVVPDITLPEPPQNSYVHPKFDKATRKAELLAKYGDLAVFASPMNPLVQTTAGTSVGHVKCHSATSGTEVLTREGRIPLQKVKSAIMSRPEAVGWCGGERQANAALRHHLKPEPGIPIRAGRFDAPTFLDWQNEMAKNPVGAGLDKLFTTNSQAPPSQSSFSFN